MGWIVHKNFLKSRLTDWQIQFSLGLFHFSAIWNVMVRSNVAILWLKPMRGWNTHTKYGRRERGWFSNATNILSLSTPPQNFCDERNTNPNLLPVFSVICNITNVTLKCELPHCLSLSSLFRPLFPVGLRTSGTIYTIKIDACTSCLSPKLQTQSPQWLPDIPTGWHLQASWGATWIVKSDRYSVQLWLHYSLSNLGWATASLSLSFLICEMNILLLHKFLMIKKYM